MKIYKVEGYGSWYLVKAQNKRKAKSDGVSEFGRGKVKSVTPAIEKDINYFKARIGNIPTVE